jgi:tetratricopeptide (TPR) repeat protein
MALFLKKRDRKVLPRWRSSRVTLTTGELGSLRAPNGRAPIEDSFFEAKKDEWHDNKSVPLATDLVGSAFVLAREDEAVEAARFIMSNSRNASGVAKDLAHRVLHRAAPRSSPGTLIVGLEEQDIRRRVHSLRVRLQNEPRDAFLWVDLALQWTLLDEREKAGKAMRRALSLAPDDRLVLRGAARLYVHVGEHGRAHSTVRDAGNVRKDPWLLAAEIATAGLAARESRLIKTGLRLLDDFSLAPMHVTELSSALATVEFSHGNHRASRKLFRFALRSPNENSLAQARWAAKGLGGLDVEDNELRVPLAFEADAILAFQRGEMEKALHQAKAWLYDQPFSVVPAQLACFLASVAFDDHRESLKIIELSERSNPDNTQLRYSKIFALASLNMTDEAQAELDRTARAPGDVTEQILALADRGLIQYRRGLATSGREFYRQAMEMAEGKALEKVRAMAAIYYAREEALSGSPDARRVLELAHRQAEGVSDPGVKIAFQSLRKLEEKLLGNEDPITVPTGPRREALPPKSD